MHASTGSESATDSATARGRVALVTGGARRIGRAICLALARVGWDVAVHHNRSSEEAHALVEEVHALGRRASALGFDLGAAGAVDGLMDACEHALGPLHAVVNSASRFSHDTIDSFELAEFEQHMRLNVAVPVQLARALHARLAEGVQGVVVNLLDQKLWNPNPDFLSYTLSKSALEAATGLLARALAPRVRVVGVAPGLTLPAPGQGDAQFVQAHRATPLGRASTPDDVARAVVFLAGAQAITGTTLLVDGGQHLLPTQRDIMFVAGTRKPA